MATYPFPDQDIVVERVEPGELTRSQLIDRATVIQEILYSAWHAKFVPQVLGEADLKTKIDPATMIKTQAERIVNPTKNAKYWLARTTTDETEANNTAALKVETYTPKTPWKDSYPNVTDLEVEGGNLQYRPYQEQAAALLFLALNDFESERKVSTWVVSEDRVARSWFEEISFERTNKHPIERVGSTTVSYRSLEAESVGAVKQALASAYPFLSTK